jgi:hypothetical protein
MTQLALPGLEFEIYTPYRSSLAANAAVLLWFKRNAFDGRIVRRGSVIKLAWVSKDTNLSRRTVQYAMRSLKKDGKIVCRRRPHGSTVELAPCASVCTSHKRNKNPIKQKGCTTTAFRSTKRTPKAKMKPKPQQPQPELIETIPKTAEAIRENFPDADDKIIQRVVVATRDATPDATDEEIANITIHCLKSKQESAALYLYTVPRAVQTMRERAKKQIKQPTCEYRPARRLEPDKNCNRCRGSGWDKERGAQCVCLDERRP